MSIEKIHENKSYYLKRVLWVCFVTSTIVALLPIKSSEPQILYQASFGLMGIVGVYCSYLTASILTKRKLGVILLTLILSPSMLLYLNALSWIIGALGQLIGIVGINRFSK